MVFLLPVFTRSYLTVMPVNMVVVIWEI